MNRWFRLIPTVAGRGVVLSGAMLLAIAACTPTGGPAATVTPAVNPHEDAKFAHEAPVAVLQGQSFARLAETKASDPALRSIAAATARDYGGIQQQLAPRLRDAGVSPPADMDGPHQVLYRQMEAMTGHAFDRAYIDNLLQDLTTTIELFQAEADSGKQPALQGVARDNLPALMEALRRAEPLSHDR